MKHLRQVYVVRKLVVITKYCTSHVIDERLTKEKSAKRFSMQSITYEDRLVHSCRQILISE